MFTTMVQTIWVLDDESNAHENYQEFFSAPYNVKMLSSLNELSDFILRPEKNSSLLIINYFYQGVDVISWLNDNELSDKIDCPFIVISSQDELNMFRSAFDHGAMDFIMKPLHKNELIAKVEKAIALERNQTVSAREVVLDGSRVSNLTSKQSQMLSLFMRSPSRSISREDILEKVWGTTTVHPKTVDVHLYNLRRKLNQHGFIIRSEGGGSWTLMSERINSH